MRIQAEVTVVDCLAETNIADYMRDCNSVKVASSRDLGTNGSVDDAASILKQKMSKNPVASLRKDGISTHNMTLGEVFASNGEEQGNFSLSKDGPNQINNDSSPIDTASMLNEAMRRYSSDANLVVTNLPFIHKNQCAQTYFHFVDKICEGIDNVMLVRGSGAEVITAYA